MNEWMNEWTGASLFVCGYLPDFEFGAALFVDTCMNFSASLFGCGYLNLNYHASWISNQEAKWKGKVGVMGVLEWQVCHV